VNIVFDVAAQDDLADIHAYYERQSEGLGDRFVVHFRRGIEHILVSKCLRIDWRRAPSLPDLEVSLRHYLSRGRESV
jgi:hypothetical protein